MYIGDYAAGSTIDFKFTTIRPSTGAPFTLAGTPALSVYKANDTTQTTTGVTLTVDFDSVTGLNHARIVTSDAFYAEGENYDVVITTGTVDSVSAVGFVVGRFSLSKVAALRPTTAGRTLDVSSTGEAGIDFANIGSPSTTVNLSATTIAAVSGNVSGNVVGSVGSVTAGVVVTTNNDKTGYSLAVTPPTAGAIADAVWDEATTGHTTAGTYGGQVLRGANSNVEVQVTGSNHVAADLHESQPGSIHATTFDSGAIDAAALATDAANEIADALLDRANAIETGLSVRGAFRLSTAALVGKSSGAETTQVTFRNVGDTTSRIVATVDANGNRSAVTTDAT